MNYAKQLNAFEEYSDRIGLPAYAQLIYYKLFAMNNRAGWAEVFEAANHFLMYKAGINNEKTFIKYRNLLKQHGLIEFVAGKKGQPTKYTLVELSAVKNTALDTVNNTVERTVNSTVNPTVNCTAIYKHKHKQFSTTPYNPPEESECDMNLSEVVKVYSSNIHPITGEIESEKLNSLLEQYGKVWLIAAIERAVQRNK